MGLIICRSGEDDIAVFGTLADAFPTRDVYRKALKFARGLSTKVLQACTDRCRKTIGGKVEYFLGISNPVMLAFKHALKDRYSENQEVQNLESELTDNELAEIPYGPDACEYVYYRLQAKSMPTHGAQVFLDGLRSGYKSIPGHKLLSYLGIMNIRRWEDQDPMAKAYKDTLGDKDLGLEGLEQRVKAYYSKDKIESEP